MLLSHFPVPSQVSVFFFKRLVYERERERERNNVPSNFYMFCVCIIKKKKTR